MSTPPIEYRTIATLGMEDLRVPVTPYDNLTKREREEMRGDQNHPWFHWRFNEETGLYRDCPFCNGYGEFPGEPGAKGCQYCESARNSDFEDHQRRYPPVSFRTDTDQGLALIKKHLNIETLAEATSSDEKMEAHYRAMQSAAATQGPHFLFHCPDCDKTKAVACNPLLGLKWDASANHTVYCDGCRKRITKARKVLTEEAA